MSKLREPLQAVTSPVKPHTASLFDLRIKEWRALLMISDITATICAVLIALIIWAKLAHGTLSLHFALNRFYWFLLLPLAWIFLATVNDSYRLRHAGHLRDTLRILFFIDMQFVILYSAVFFFVPRDLLPRLFVLWYALLVLLFTATVRTSRILLMRSQGFRRRVLVVGAGNVARMMLLALKDEAANEYDVIGCVTSVHDTSSLPGDIPILGFGAELPEIVQQQGIAEVIMAYINEIPIDIFDGLIECYQSGVTVVSMPQLYEDVTGRVPIEHIGQRLWSLVLPLDSQSFRSKINGAIKRIMDIILSLLGIILFVIFLPIIALLIKADSRGPVFFLQRRVGQGGRHFTIIKLRTMIREAEKTSGPLWASADDPRITRVGRALRKTRLDEVPQLINVLRGDMSIVGPRPERPEFVMMLAKNITFYQTRLVVKPGLTGWAQIRYRYGSSQEDALLKLQFDLYYIRHQSLLLDLIIMLRTFIIMLRFQGT